MPLNGSLLHGNFNVPIIYKTIIIGTNNRARKYMHWKLPKSEFIYAFKNTEYALKYALKFFLYISRYVL